VCNAVGSAKFKPADFLSCFRNPAKAAMMAFRARRVYANVDFM
jgi:hypothetical protein